MFTPTHVVLLIILLLVALLVFGPKRLPDVGRSVGRTIQEFKRAASAQPAKALDGSDKSEDLKSES